MWVLAAALVVAATPAFAQDACVSVVEAHLAIETTAYGHGAVKNGEYEALDLAYHLNDASVQTARINTTVDHAVFEDTHVRVVDLDGDGCNEAVVTTASQEKGAFVSVYGFDPIKRSNPDGRRDEQTELGPRPKPLGQSTPIGTRYRWLAIAGIADFDGDGIQDIAYVDRPHLAKTLRILRTIPRGKINGRQMFGFSELASLSGVTNHHHGSPVIEGGLRNCDADGPVIVTADSAWENVVETRMTDGVLHSETVGKYSGVDSFAQFLTCDAR
jgi:hypothetical protein